MKEFGFLYYPYSCLDKSCNLHVALHNCGFGNAIQWIYPNDYVTYAASNDLIILMPTAELCWDVQAETGPLYATN